MTIETPTRQTSTLAERLTRTGEAILDLVSVLPEDASEYIQLAAEGWKSREADLHLHVSMEEAYAVLRAVGAPWQHTLNQHETGEVHHHWTGDLHGATVRMVAVWSPPKGGEPRG